jgi:hypothetical protein
MRCYPPLSAAVPHTAQFVVASVRVGGDAAALLASTLQTVVNKALAAHIATNDTSKLASVDKEQGQPGLGI